MYRKRFYQYISIVVYVLGDVVIGAPSFHRLLPVPSHDPAAIWLLCPTPELWLFCPEPEVAVEEELLLTHFATSDTIIFWAGYIASAVA